MGEAHGVVTERRKWTGTALPRYRTAGGAIVSIEAPGFDLSQPWFSEFRLRAERPYVQGPSGPLHRAFQVGPLGTMANHAHHVIKGQFTDVLSFSGGSVLVARSDVDGRGLAGWQGRWHEVYLFQNSSGWSVSDVLRQFQGLEISDEPMGASVKSVGIPPETMYGERVHKQVPGVGVISIVSGADGVTLLPSWAGARTPSGGEVWRKHVRADETGRTVLMHASRSAITAVYAEPGEKEIETPRLAFLDAVVDVQWNG